MGRFTFIAILAGFGVICNSLGAGIKEKGTCVWYGAQGEIPEGWPTSSGEGFSRYALASTHKTLPFNTLVRVTNEDNNRTVDVRINDRGPWGTERILDLTWASFGKIDEDWDKGTTPCHYELL